MPFAQLGLIPSILDALTTEWYTKPTPIQEKAIPLILAGKDLLGVAQTGTGKTAAFALPMIQLLSESKSMRPGKRMIRGLILTPTRELAIQIEESFANYGRNTKLKSSVIFGGVGQQKQVDTLRNGVDIVIATPGRLLDLMQQGFIDLHHIEFFVLDEADRMLDMGFVHDVRRVITKLPVKRQSLFFSATMPPAIVELAGKILTNPSRVEVTPPSSTAHLINQSVYFVDKHNKKHLLIEVLQDQSIERVLVFTRTKHGADKVVRELDTANIPALAIHGNKSQNNRQRALLGFKNKEIRVLVATDIAARGIDIDELTHVINFELPNVSESYVHRIGRTGRAGASGIAIAFCDAEEREYLRDIERLIALKIPVIQDHGYPLMNEEIEKSPSKSPRGPRNHGDKMPVAKGDSRKTERKEPRDSKKFAPKSEARTSGFGYPSDTRGARKSDGKREDFSQKPYPKTEKNERRERPSPSTWSQPREIRSGERVSWGKVTKRSEKSFSKYKDSIAPKKSESPSEEKKIFKKPEFKEREMGNSEREPSKKSWKKPESKKRSPPKNPKPFVPSPPRRIQKSSDQ